VDQEFALFLGRMNKEDLVILSDLMQAGKMTPVIDKRYPLSEVAAAIQYSEKGHARGKIVVAVE
jgi:NADPH:quinone reductase-like Zn-dependent oxidoreductase